MRFYALLFSLAILFFACDSTPKEIAVRNNVNSINTFQDDSLNEIKKVDIPTELVEYLIYKQNLVHNQLKSQTKSDVSQFYKKYKAENDSVLLLLMNRENDLLENYYSIFFDENGKSKKLSKSLKEKLAHFSEANVKLWEVGEGIVELRMLPDFYLKVFKNYAAEDLIAYLAINAAEDKVLYAADAGLAITIKELGERIATWEKFLKKYPKFSFKNDALELYKMYQLNYLVGMDNTPVRDYETNAIYEENQKEFDRFSAKYPSSLTTKFIKQMITENLFGENLYKILEKEQAKLN